MAKTKAEQKKQESNQKKRIKTFEKRQKKLKREPMISTQRCRDLIRKELSNVNDAMGVEKNMRPSDAAVDLIRRIVIAVGSATAAECDRVRQQTNFVRVNKKIMEAAIKNCEHHRFLNSHYLPQMN